jgi:acetolactate synthase-1/2/3 large subunit
VDLPKDVVQAMITYKPIKDVHLRSYNPNYEPNMKQLAKVGKLIASSKKPMIFAGGGVILSDGSNELRKFGRKIQAPVTASLMGLGAFPASDPLWLGMIGMHGTYRANMASADCDLLLAIGVRFDDRVTGKVDSFAPKAKIVHIDIDPTSISKNIPVTIPIVGDCRITLKRLNQLLENEDLGNLTTLRKPWLEKIITWKETKPLAYDQKKIIKPQYVIEELYRLTKGKAIITTEVGQNQMWAAQYFHFDEPNHFITSGGLGCMGFGFPAAIGAQVAQPDQVVVDIAGDGSIQMNIQEMATAVQYQIPVKIAILNNGYLGMVRQWQELFYDKCYACTQMKETPDFVKLAEAYGALGLRAEKPGEVTGVLKKGLAAKGPVIMDFVVEQEECVYPMVPSGAPITEMLLV